MGLPRKICWNENLNCKFCFQSDCTILLKHDMVPQHYEYECNIVIVVPQYCWGESNTQKREFVYDWIGYKNRMQSTKPWHRHKFFVVQVVPMSLDFVSWQLKNFLLTLMKPHLVMYVQGWILSCKFNQSSHNFFVEILWKGPYHIPNIAVEIVPRLG